MDSASVKATATNIFSAATANALDEALVERLALTCKGEQEFAILLRSRRQVVGGAG